MPLLLVLILSACATQQSNTQRPNWVETAKQVLEERKPIKEGRELPTLCEIDGQTGAWSAACWLVFEKYEVIAEGNTKIAKANASALRNTEGAVDSLIQAGIMEQRLTDFYAELLNEERQGRFIDGLINKGVIGIILIGAVL